MSSYVVNVIFAVVVCLASFSHVTCADCVVVANINVSQDFNITAYAGKWYEINFKPPYYYDTNTAWMNFYEIYTLDNSTGTPQLNITAYGRDPKKNYTCVGGSDNSPLKVGDAITPAKLFSVQQVNSSALNLGHWVLNTDYVTYAVIYGCLRNNTDGTCNETTAKVHSRNRTITDPAVLNTINSTLANVCLDITMLPPVWQNDTLCTEATTPTTTTALPTPTTTASGTELMTSSLPALLFAMLLAVVNYQRHAAH